MKLHERLHTTTIFHAMNALLSAEAALPHLLARGRASAPTAPADRGAIPRARRLWSREDGFTMAGARR